MKLQHLLFASIFSFYCSAAGAQTAMQYDLSGTWRFQLDPMGFGKTPGSELYQAKLAETITLPGSTDTGGKGIRTTARYIDRLTRQFEYCGMAWYQREVVIPENWAGKVIRMNLERCHWETGVYVDGELVAWDERLSTPNRFDLTKQLTPGTHTITLCIDNRLKYPMDHWNHGTTEYTQTNWNGVVGEMMLEAIEPVYIGGMDIYPDIKDRKAVLKTTLMNVTGKETEGTLHLVVREKQSGKTVYETQQKVALAQPELQQEIELPMGKNMKLWDEFHPFLYEVTARLTVGEAEHACSETFGMRQVEQGAHHIRLNGRDIHLRGALDCAAFPLTGYPATDVA